MMAGLTTFAQNLPEGTYMEKNGIAYRKAATLKPGTTDRYIIDIEAFVTGAVHKVVSSKPADIVLVLDVSGSMNEEIYEYTYSSVGSDSYSYYDIYYYHDGYNEYYPLLYYKHTDGKYYQVNSGYTGGYNNTRYYIYYTVGNTNYYLSGNSTTTTQPTNTTNQNSTIWTGVLYRYVQGASKGTKLANLKTAVSTFIDKIVENDLYETDESGKVVIDEATGNPKRRKGVLGADTTLGNRIAIVKYARDRYVSGNINYNNWRNPNAPITVSGDGNNRDNSGYNYTEVVRAFTLTGTAANVTNLKNAVNGFRAGGATASDYGMNLAWRLLDNIPEARDTSDTKTVVFFTDGSPTYGSDFSSTVADHTISRAHDAKQMDAKVFTVGVFSNLGDDADDVDKYMNYTSSNYPDAIGFNQGYTPVPTAERVFYQNANDADLTSIFTAIAEASGGSGNTDVSGTSPVTVDVIAASFALPTGASADDITVKVAKCVGKEGNYLQFDEPVAPSAAGFTITPTVNTTTQKVSTTGFDFSANWCGYNEDTGKYQGYKQIISFEIKVNDNAVGGPDVLTNEENSGIFLAGATEPLVKFNRPTVKIPISIWIKKQGLEGDDTAVFTIEYAEYDPTVTNPSTLPKSAWKSFDKVAINSNSEIDSDGYPIVRLTGLDPDFFYRIREDQWAWSYDYQASGIQYTVGSGGSNPFVFVNKPKDTVKENESSVRNEFNERTEKISAGTNTETQR